MKKLFNETEWDRVIGVLSLFAALMWFFPGFTLIVIFLIIYMQTA
jgi:hypothetical protein